MCPTHAPDTWRAENRVRYGSGASCASADSAAATVARVKRIRNQRFMLTRRSAEAKKTELFLLYRLRQSFRTNRICGLRVLPKEPEERFHFGEQGRNSMKPQDRGCWQFVRRSRHGQPVRDNAQRVGCDKQRAGTPKYFGGVPALPLVTPYNVINWPAVTLAVDPNVYRPRRVSRDLTACIRRSAAI